LIVNASSKNQPNAQLAVSRLIIPGGDLAARLVVAFAVSPRLP
jgi:hypothetical protein